MLAKIPELQVAARTSSFSFKGQNLEIPEIAERLNVAHVLEGSVRKAGNEVRITAQLIRADDGFHVWSDTWDRTLDDIFAIQDEIAAEVVAQLKVTLLGAAPTVEETDPEAYALFLQARHLYRQGNSREPRSIQRRCTSGRWKSSPTTPRRGVAWPAATSSKRRPLRPVARGGGLRGWPERRPIPSAGDRTELCSKRTPASVESRCSMTMT